MVLPFAKKSTIWETYETMEVFQRVPQNPHFSPLLEAKEDFREGSALGLMVTFSTLMEKLKDLEADVPISQLDSLKDSFTELERHGFNVTTPLTRISTLLALKDRQQNIMEKLKSIDHTIMEESSKQHKVEEERSEMKSKILELQREQVALKEQKETTYNKKCHMESCAKDLSVELEDVECEFERISSAPW